MKMNWLDGMDANPENIMYIKYASGNSVKQYTYNEPPVIRNF